MDTCNTVKHGKPWSRRAGICWTAGIVAAHACALCWLMAAPRNSEAYRLGRDLLEQDPAVIEQYGGLLTTGVPSGTVTETGPDGAANLEFIVQGARAAGKVFLASRRRLGRWEIVHLTVRNSASGARIVVR